MKTRLRKADCPRCGYIVRVSRKCIAQGLPTCPCGTRMTCPEPVDAALVPKTDERDQEQRFTVTVQVSVNARE
jgi:hypothetical protein